jgi:hypothetical protein
MSIQTHTQWLLERAGYGQQSATLFCFSTEALWNLLHLPLSSEGVKWGWEGASPLSSWASLRLQALSLPCPMTKESLNWS